MGPLPVRFLSVLLAVLLAAAPAVARELTADERLADFDQLVGFVRASYGMLQYKQELLKVDLAQVAAAYRAKVTAVASDDRFYDLLSAFLSEFRDAHVGHFRPSTMRARLGFALERIEEKAVIVEIDRALLPEESFPFHVGDELVAIDGKPVARLVTDLVPMHASSSEESSLGLMTRSLTERAGWLGAVPQGVAQLSIRPFGQDEPQTIATPWIVTGKPLPGLSFHAGGDQPFPLKPGQPSAEMSVNPIAAAFGSKRAPAWMPGAGAQAFESKYFAAAQFDSPKGLLGYIRIPTFAPGDATAAAAEFQKLLVGMRFIKGLVVDVNDNPGGSLFYCYKIASMLTDRPLKIMEVSERASRVNLNNYQTWAQYTDSAHTKALYEISAEAMRTAMAAGQEMTPFMNAFGVAGQAPDGQVNFTGPVLILINDQCYSCGDIFPAIMKDNGRAVLMGKTTAGAGGAVGSYGPLSYTGSSINLTQNLMRRPDGTFIENVGVAPDVRWEHSQADVAAGYEAYRAAYMAKLLELVR